MRLRLLKFDAARSTLRLKREGLPSAPPAGSFGPVAAQSFTRNTGNQTYTFPAATGADLTWTYELVSPPAGVTLAGRTITFDTAALAIQSGTIYTVRATDQFSRSIEASNTFAIEASTLPAVITITSVGPEAGGDLPFSYTIDKNDATVEAVLFDASEPDPVAADFGGANPTYIDQGTLNLTAPSGSTTLTLAGSPADGSYKLALLPTGPGNVVVSTAFDVGVWAPTGTLNLATEGREVTAWVSDISARPAATLTLTQFDAATVNVLNLVGGNGTVENPWAYRAAGLGSVAIDVAAQLANGESPNWSDSDTITIPASVWNSGMTYTASITAVDSEDDDGNLNRLVSSPAHLAAYDFGTGVNGLMEIRADEIASGPKVLYPGLLAISAPDPGGSISLTNAPFGAGNGGTITTTYSVRLGSTELATSLPYDTTSLDPGDIVEVFGEMSDTNGTTPEFKIGEFTLEENPLGPVLSDFAIDYAGNAISFFSNLAATVTWRRYPPGHVFVNQAAEVLAGTGAIDGGSYAIEIGPNSDPVTFTGGISGPQELWIVARVGSGPISNVIGGAVNITVASSLTAPTIVGTSIGGDGASIGVAGTIVALPDVPMEVGDLVTLPIGIDCAASFIVGLTATGPNGEVATVKQALVDNEEGGNSAAAIALLYYRNTVARTGGNVSINITPGGFKSAEQIICTPIVRRNVKASGDPFAQVLRTFSTTATATASTAALTSVSAASRIEASIVSNTTLPPGAAPTGWFMREVGLIGPQAMQTMSRNDQTEAASQSIGAVSVSLGATSQPWVALTWELLPLGAA